MINNSKYDALIVIDHYLPGRMAGGPVTTISNMVIQFDGRLKFMIVTRNYDLDGRYYENIRKGDINNVQGADVIYVGKNEFSSALFERLASKYDIPAIYLNSFFSSTAVKTILAHRAGRIKRHLILAPRGEFSIGALKLKARKKQIYLYLFRLFRLDRQVNVFQASSHLEKLDIWRALGPVPVHVAPDVTAPVRPVEYQPPFDPPRLVFISRITPKKNLTYAIEVLRQLDLPVVLDIYGPHEDEAYWQQCRLLIADLPPRIQVNDCGTLEHDEIAPTFARYAAFLFPTLGENYGHVIFESLAAGCPVLVSDQTPWQDLAEKKVGWVIPLSDQGVFVETVRRVLTEQPESRQMRAARCIEYARRVAEDPEVLSDNINLFRLGGP